MRLAYKPGYPRSILLEILAARQTAASHTGPRSGGNAKIGRYLDLLY
jgi:hypothetical protein